MTLHLKKVIKICEEKCAGCQICQLICSYTHHKIFSPDQAFIKVITHELMPQITFLEGCTLCYKCVKHCLYGALELEEMEQ